MRLRSTCKIAAFSIRLVAGLAGALSLTGGGCATPMPAVVDPIGAPTDIRSVDQFLATLPQTLRAHYVLMFETRSPQGASYESPRVLFYGEDAKYVVGFSGHSEAIDLMSFDEDRRAFVFREVTFHHGGGGRSMQVSEANPERCGVCHGTPARPIWDSYPLWPGAYGESALAAPSAAERDGYARFERASRGDPRYRYLAPHHETAIEAAERRYDGLGERPNNVEFGELLSALQAKAIAAQLRASPNFDRTRYALLEALTGRCRDAAGLWGPEGHAEGRGPARYAAFAATTERANREQAVTKSYRAHGGDALPRVAPADSTGMTGLRYIVEHDLGISTATWTLALEQGTYDFRVSDRPAATFESRLFTEIAGPGERAVELLANASDTSSLCAYLEGHARDARSFEARVPAVGSHAEASTPALIERCARCHELGVGPRIPFGHLDELARALPLPTASGRSLLEETRDRLGPEAGVKRMPPEFIASADDRAKLMATLEELAGGGP